MVPLNPKITNAGLALFPNPTGSGFHVTLTHIAIGTAKYDPSGAETGLAAEVARFPILAGGIAPATPYQVQIGANITDIDPSGRSANEQWIGEIGFYAGPTLFAVWSRPNKPLFYKTSDFDVPVAYRLDVSRLPQNSVTVAVDIGFAGMQSLLIQHELSPDPHPQYLTPGEGAAAFEARFPKGTRMLFQQTAAPLGWTKVTTFNDAALRVVSGAVGSGGTMDFTAAFSARTPTGSVSTTGTVGTTGTVATTGSVSTTGTVATTGTVTTNGTVSGTTLTIAQMPSHSHINTVYSRSGSSAHMGDGGDTPTYSGVPTASAGGDGSHTHGFSATSTLSASSTFVGASTFSGASTFTGASTFSGSSSFAGTSMNFAVKYADVIIASKD